MALPDNPNGTPLKPIRATALGTEKGKRASAKKVKRLRRQLLALHGFRCHWCGFIMGDDDQSLEHIVPVRDGGRTDQNNCRVVHRNCNR